ncbi:MAG: DMT family transporter [Candidatus Diapherotrites archaeon]
MESKIAVLGLIVASLIWAITGVSFKILLSEGLSFALILWVIVIFRFISVALISKYKNFKHEWVKDTKELKIILLNALFALGTPVLFVLALEQLNLSTVYFIVFTAPAWVLVFAVFFLGEKLRLKKIIGLLLTLLGVYFIVNPENIGVNVGFFFALLAALSFSGDIITGRELKDYHFHTVALYANGFQVIVLTIVTFLFFEFPSFNHPFLFLSGLILLGLFRGLASDFYYYALEKLEASTASIITLAELIFASLLAFLILNEIPTQTEVIGYGFILVSGLLLILRRSDIEHFEYLIHLRRKH